MIGVPTFCGWYLGGFVVAFATPTAALPLEVFFTLGAAYSLLLAFASIMFRHGWVLGICGLIASIPLSILIGDTLINGDHGVASQSHPNLLWSQ
jgi:hypothetical protein